MQQQSRRTNAKSRSRDQKNLSFTSYAERRSGASTTSDNTGRGPERLQTAPRSQVLVKAHVPARREAQRRLSFPDTLAGAGAQKRRLQSQ